MTYNLVERLRAVNIVERLRAADVSWSYEGELCACAADRIEQLEAALREVVKVDCGFVCKCAEIARTALEEIK